MNHPVRDLRGRRRYLDAAYLPERLPVELDGQLFHGTALERHDDRWRDNALVLAGWRQPLRYSWWDLNNEPGRVVEEIKMGLRAARRDKDSHVPLEFECAADLEMS